MEQDEYKSFKVDEATYRKAKMIAGREGKKIYVVIGEALEAAEKLIIERDRYTRLKKAYNNIVERRKQDKQKLSR